MSGMWAYAGEFLSGQWRMAVNFALIAATQSAIAILTQNAMQRRKRSQKPEIIYWTVKMLILVDGFIMTNCLLAASRLCPAVTDYAIFGHQGDESGHKLLLEYLHAKPLLYLGLRLGEGSGAVCAYPIVDSAVRMMNEMETFSHASITKYF